MPKDRTFSETELFILFGFVHATLAEENEDLTLGKLTVPQVTDAIERGMAAIKGEKSLA